MPDLIRLNGRVFSAKSCIFTMFGFPTTAIVSAAVADKLDVEVVKDADRSGVPIGSTAGSYSVDSATITVLTDVWRLTLRPRLVALNALAGSPGATGMAEWPFSWQLAEPGYTTTKLVENCRLGGESDKYDEGIEKAVTELTLIGRMTVTTDGATLFDRTRSIPF